MAMGWCLKDYGEAVRPPLFSGLRGRGAEASEDRLAVLCYHYYYYTTIDMAGFGLEQLPAELVLHITYCEMFQSYADV